MHFVSNDVLAVTIEYQELIEIMQTFGKHTIGGPRPRPSGRENTNKGFYLFNSSTPRDTTYPLDKIL